MGHQTELCWATVAQGASAVARGRPGGADGADGEYGGVELAVEDRLVLLSAGLGWVLKPGQSWLPVQLALVCLLGGRRIDRVGQDVEFGVR